jgi:hypothetical protein
MRRLNIGGKLLTNYLKELVSYRQWNMMDEYILMNQVGTWLAMSLVLAANIILTTRVSLQVKESLCYVSADFMGELQAARLAGKVTRAPAAQPVGGNSDASSGANTLGRTAPALDPMGGALKKQFVLPDFHTVLKGYVKPDDEPSDPTEQVCGYVFASYDVPVEGPLQLSDVRKDTARLIAVDFPSRCWLWRQSASACRNCFLTRGTSVS